MTTLLVYGSLCSGFGLRNLGKLAVERVERVRLGNCRRGFGKLSRHGDRYAMVLEPQRHDEPIRAESAAASTACPNALALTVGTEDLGRISLREGYDPGVLRRLEKAAHERNRTVGEHLWRMLEAAGFDPAEYRRGLFAETGYTSPHYIPHPVSRTGEEPALVFLPPGPEGSGDESVVPVRVATGMAGVLSIGRAWQHKRSSSQLEYFAMCLLAEMHGLSFADVLGDLEPDSELAQLLRATLQLELAKEADRFQAALGLSPDRYAELQEGRTERSWLLDGQ